MRKLLTLLNIFSFFNLSVTPSFAVNQFLEIKEEIKRETRPQRGLLPLIVQDRDETFHEYYISGSGFACGFRLFGLERQQGVSLLEKNLTSLTVQKFIKNSICNEDSARFFKIFKRAQPTGHLEKFASKSRNQKLYLNYFKKDKTELDIIGNCYSDGRTAEGGESCLGLMDALAYIQRKNLYIYKKPENDEHDLFLYHVFSMPGNQTRINSFYKGHHFNRLVSPDNREERREALLREEEYLKLTAQSVQNATLGDGEDQEFNGYLLSFPSDSVRAQDCFPVKEEETEDDDEESSVDYLPLSPREQNSSLLVKKEEENDDSSFRSSSLSSDERSSSSSEGEEEPSFITSELANFIDQRSPTLPGLSERGSLKKAYNVLSDKIQAVLDLDSPRHFFVAKVIACIFGTARLAYEHNFCPQWQSRQDQARGLSKILMYIAKKLDIPSTPFQRRFANYAKIYAGKALMALNEFHKAHTLFRQVKKQYSKTGLIDVAEMILEHGYRPDDLGDEAPEDYSKRLLQEAGKRPSAIPPRRRQPRPKRLDQNMAVEKAGHPLFANRRRKETRKLWEVADPHVPSSSSSSSSEEEEGEELKETISSPETRPIRSNKRSAAELQNKQVQKRPRMVRKIPSSSSSSSEEDEDSPQTPREASIESLPSSPLDLGMTSQPRSRQNLRKRSAFIALDIKQEPSSPKRLKLSDQVIDSERETSSSSSSSEDNSILEEMQRQKHRENQILRSFAFGERTPHQECRRLLLLAEATKGEESEKYIDQAEKFVRELKSDQLMARVLVNKGNNNRKINSTDEAIRCFNEALKLAHPKSITAIKANIGIGNKYGSLKKDEEASVYFKKAYKDALNNDFKDLQVQALLGLGNFRNHEAEGRLRKALEIANAISHVYLQTRAHLSLGNITFGQERKEHFEKAVSLADKSKEKHLQVRARLGLVESLFAEKEYEKAIKYMKEARELAEKTENSELKILTYRSLGEALIHKGKHEKAREYLEKALSLARAEEVNDKELEVRILTQLGGVEGPTRITYGLEAVQQAQSENNENRLIRAHMELANSLCLEKRYNEAMDHSKIAINLSKVVKNSIKEKGMHEPHMEILYGEALRAAAQVASVASLNDMASKLYQDTLIEIETQENPVMLPRVYLSYGQFLWGTRKKREAVEYFNKALLRTKQTKEKFLKAKAHLGLARTLNETSDKLKHALKALSISLRLEEEGLQAKCYLKLGDIYCFGKKSSDSSKVVKRDPKIGSGYYEKALSLAKKRNNNVVQIKALLGLVKVKSQTNPLEKLKEALDLANTVKKKELEAEVCLQMGLTLVSEKEPGSLAFFKKATELAESKELRTRTLISYGKELRYNEQYNEASECLTEAIRLSKELGNTNLQTDALIAKGYVFISCKSTKEAMVYFLEAEKIAPSEYSKTEAILGQGDAKPLVFAEELYQRAFNMAPVASLKGKARWGIERAQKAKKAQAAKRNSSRSLESRSKQRPSNARFSSGSRNKGDN